LRKILKSYTGRAIIVEGEGAVVETVLMRGKGTVSAEPAKIPCITNSRTLAYQEAKTNNRGYE
jgi:hypothetical protein